MNELVDNPKAILILRLLATNGPMNVREFGFYTRMREATARALRDRMQNEWGLITVGPARIRTTTDLEIGLTKEGLALAQHFLAADPLFEEAKRKAPNRRA
jgi:hypothetical protein